MPPSLVTSIWPVVAPAGTMAEIAESDAFTVNVAAMPLKVRHQPLRRPIGLLQIETRQRPLIPYVESSIGESRVGSYSRRQQLST